MTTLFFSKRGINERRSSIGKIMIMFCSVTMACQKDRWIKYTKTISAETTVASMKSMMRTSCVTRQRVMQPHGALSAAWEFQRADILSVFRVD
jgi:tellurite resistance protein TehA-like permease